MPRRKSSSLVDRQNQSCLPRLVERWILRLLVSLNGHQKFLTTHGFSDDPLAEALGFSSSLDLDSEDFVHKKVLARLRQRARISEQHADYPLPALLQDNIDRLAALAALSQTDCKILAFAIMIHNHQILDEASNCLGHLSTLELYRVLAKLLDLAENDVRLALSPRGLLTRSGLLTVERQGTEYLCGKFNLLSYTFADTVFSTECEPESLLRDLVTPASQAHLTWQDYAHVNESMMTLRAYISKAAARRQQGVNILIHGLAGTGKSQLARVLAAHVHRELFEVAFADEEGDSVSGERRLRAYRAAQCFFANREVVLVFDEAEDVLLGNEDMFDRRPAQSRKAWLNRTLEENPVPALWLSNNTDCIDPAVARRFDMVIELPIPSRKHRARILEGLSHELLTASEISVFAQSDALSPAVAQKAFSVVQLIKDDLSAHEIAPTIKRLTNSTLKAQGYRALDQMEQLPLPALYDPTLINCERDPVKVAQGIKRAGSARLCLFGPSGTGKTAYAQWIAQELDTPLIVKKASELMGMYVGQTEKKIAHAFAQAKDEGAILLIDEVDSFLLDRRSARTSWEVSMVNEMLTQLESFDGIFIAATNLMENLDQAVLRRFDLKLKFHYLAPEQIKRLATRCCETLQLEDISTDELTALGCLGNLTLGDFATVARQHRFCPFTSARDLVEALQSECTIKEVPARSIGFVH